MRLKTLVLLAVFSQVARAQGPNEVHLISQLQGNMDGLAWVPAGYFQTAPVMTAK